MARVILHEYCSEARQLIESRAYDAAIAICLHILKRYPKHIETYRLLGEACLEKGELNEAADIFKRVLNADPENLAAHAGLGFIYQERQQLAQAIWHMERAFELAPNNEEARNALRRLYGQRDGAEPARIKLNKVALARLYSRGGQYRQAIEEFNRWLELEPTRMDIRVSLAETFWRDARREQAAEAAREILKTCPDCLKAILLLGAIQMEKGRTDEGKQILARARTLDPENRMAQAIFGEDSPLPAQPVLVPRAPEPIPVPAGPAAPESEMTAVPEAESEPGVSQAEELEQQGEALTVVEPAQATEAPPSAPPIMAVPVDASSVPEAAAFPVGEVWSEQAVEAPATPAETITTVAAEGPETVFPLQGTVPAQEPVVAAASAEQSETRAVPTAEAAHMLEPASAPEAAAEPERAPFVEAETLVASILEATSVHETALAEGTSEVSVAPPVSEAVEIPEGAVLEMVSAQEASPALEAIESSVPPLATEQAEASAGPAAETVPVQETEAATEPREASVSVSVTEATDVLAAPPPEARPVEEVQPVPEPSEIPVAALPTELVQAVSSPAAEALAPSEAPTASHEVAISTEGVVAPLSEALVEGVPAPSVEVAPVAEVEGEQAPVTAELTPSAISAIRSTEAALYEQQLQQNPKDERTRLSLARVYRDQEQVEQALEQYRALAKAKSETIAEAIEDMESIVASRPGNLAAHELLADLYAKNGQLQKAMERYRWLVQQLEQKPA